MTDELIKNGSHFRIVFDLMPIPVFILDSDLKVISANKQSLDFFRPNGGFVQRCLCGEMLNCLNALKSEKKCGKTKFCPDCVLNNAIKESIAGKKVFRQKYDMLLKLNGSIQPVTFLVTASPFQDNGSNYSLIALEDITELTELRDIIPMCSACKKIRDDEGLWENVETYMKRYTNLDFSHGICPDCAKRLYPDVDIYEDTE
ncbi:MAG: PAS domain-containing protein [Desulfobacterales bacterium]|jgi:PAS domain-containing protein|nr:PAS domain-containing protein [Desulfobacteraceae bacterium]MBT4363848.1 PAS domain-containing protein [Desulfobacteraceae bacterium]MBT7086077.1 PAS domain-containing protein [Desulfobacterales bacterium]MBT7695894.1 PAS domain-containing protein [Desulfobacterales bacterium]